MFLLSGAEVHAVYRLLLRHWWSGRNVNLQPSHENNLPNMMKFYNSAAVQNLSCNLKTRTLQYPPMATYELYLGYIFL